jgi:hypothetical protein
MGNLTSDRFGVSAGVVLAQIVVGHVVQQRLQAVIIINTR